MNDIKLPELPKPDYIGGVYHQVAIGDAYTESTMNAYATEYGDLCHLKGREEEYAALVSIRDFDQWEEYEFGFDEAYDQSGREGEIAKKAFHAGELTALKQSLAQPVQERCQYCDDTGDVHNQTGEWRGTCSCPAGKPAPAQSVPVVPDGCVAVDRAMLSGMTNFLEASIEVQGGSPEEPPDYQTQFDMQLAQCVDALRHVLEHSSPIEAQRDERALFHEWATKSNKFGMQWSDEGNCYCLQHTQVAWMAWQAAIKSMGSGES